MDLLDVFKALSNRTRLEILKGLKDPANSFPPQDEGDVHTVGVCVSSIQEGVGLSQSTVSDYLATLQRANVRVDVLYQKLPVRVSAVLDWISMVALAVFMVFLTYYAFEVVQMSWTQKSAANTPLATPLWIPQGLWLLGLAWMCITVALMLARASAALVTGDIELVKEICGVRSAQEEADEEAAAGERMVKGATA